MFQFPYIMASWRIKDPISLKDDYDFDRFINEVNVSISDKCVQVLDQIDQVYTIIDVCTRKQIRIDAFNKKPPTLAKRSDSKDQKSREKQENYEREKSRIQKLQQTVIDKIRQVDVRERNYFKVKLKSILENQLSIHDLSQNEQSEF
mmetsp:Transcript_32819/g.50121  ORF Transcript_32819/g.50121 Transcript_32819/m.50121 type:complete len:147 (+) Transcript_32819:4090-4530(+)